MLNRNIVWNDLSADVVFCFFERLGLQDQISLACSHKNSRNNFETFKKASQHKKKFLQHFPYWHMNDEGLEEKSDAAESWYRRVQEAEKKEYHAWKEEKRRLFSWVKESKIEFLKEYFLKKAVVEESKEEDLSLSLSKEIREIFRWHDRMEYTLLHWARHNQDTVLLTYFYDLLINYCVTPHKSPLYWAIQCKQPLNLVRKLLSSSPVDPSLSPYKIAIWAVETGYSEVLEYLITQYPQLREEFLTLIPPEEGGTGRSIMHRAIISCPFSSPVSPIIEQLLAAAPPLLNHESWQEGSPLCLALERGHIKLGEYLLKQQDIAILPTHQSKSRDTPLHKIIKSFYSPEKERFFSFISRLLERYPSLLNEQNAKQCTPLFLAISQGSVELTKFLLHQTNIENPITVNEAGRTILHSLARRKDLFIEEEDLSRLLTTRPELLNQPDEEGYTALNLAVLYRHEERARYLLEQEDIDAMAADYKGNTALHAVFPDYEVSKNLLSLSSIRMLLTKAPALLHQKNNDGFTPVHLAIRAGGYAVPPLYPFYQEVVEFFLNQESIEKGQALDPNNKGDTPLHTLVRGRRYEKKFLTIMQLLLSKKPDFLNQRNKSGHTPLMRAIDYRYEHGVEYLLKQADIDLRGVEEEENTVLHYAIQDSRGYGPDVGIIRNAIQDSRGYGPDVGIIRMLIDKEPALLRQKNKSGSTPLQWAIETHQVTAVDFFLHLGNVENGLLEVDEQGNTLLHFAILHYNTSGGDSHRFHLIIIDRLIRKAPALLHKRNKRGFTPFHLAIRYQRAEVVEFFLRHPPCENAFLDQDEEGNTLLHEAILIAYASPDLAFIQALLEKEPLLLCQKNKRGFTPLRLAIQRKKTAAVDFFLHYPPRENAFLEQNEEGNTLLHEAILTLSASPDLALIQALLEKEPLLLCQKNKRGFTPLRLAIHRNQTAVVKFFLSYPTIENPLLDQDEEGNTLLHEAILTLSASPDLALIQALLKKEPLLLCQKNKRGFTSLRLAIQRNQTAVVKFFLSYPPIENPSLDQDEEGNTLLHEAITTRQFFTRRQECATNLTIIQAVFEKKPSLLHQKNNRGISPWCLAKNMSSSEVRERFCAIAPARIREEMIVEMQEVIKFFWKKECAVELTEDAFPFPAWELSFAEEKDAEMVCERLNAYLNAGHANGEEKDEEVASAIAQVGQPLQVIRKGNKFILLISTVNCHNILQKAEEDFIKRYNKLEQFLQGVSPRLQSRITASMRKIFGILIAPSFEEKAFSMQKVRRFQEEVQRSFLPPLLKIALTTLAIAFAVYGLCALATGIAIAIPVATAAVVPIGYVVNSFFNPNHHSHNDIIQIRKILEEPASTALCRASS
ncbi:MAG: protein 6-like [Gammaproteobacteria bacterium]|nr:protein 6-like [Gammaproteobacteria bacterium]